MVSASVGHILIVSAELQWMLSDSGSGVREEGIHPSLSRSLFHKLKQAKFLVLVGEIYIFLVVS